MPKWLYMRLGHGGLFRFFPLYDCYSVTIFFPYQYGTQYEMVMWQDHEHEVGFGHSWMRTIINTHTKKKNEKKKLTKLVNVTFHMSNIVYDTSIYECM